MVFSKRTVAAPTKVDVREAFALWDILKSKYDAVEHVHVWQDFVHDIDLKAFLEAYRSDLIYNIKILEGLMRKSEIRGPNQNRPRLKSSVNPDHVTDQLIAGDAMQYISEHIENLLRSFKSAFTNDTVRSALMKMLKRTVTLADTMFKYMKLKAWIEDPPLYKLVPESSNELITVGEAGQIWDHLTFRYDNLHQTRIYRAYSRDGDFQLLLDMGVNLLLSQVEQLEEEAQKFGIPIPKKPSAIVPKPSEPDMVPDDHMYRMILIGMQAATLLHAEALKRAMVNDRLRAMFKKLVYQELSFFDRYVKYGKVKGWIHPAPTFK